MEFYEIEKNINNALVTHSQYRDALNSFDRLMRCARLQSKGQGLLLVGQAGVGKSRIAEQIQQNYPSVEEEERDLIEVVVTSMPANPTIKGICMNILNSLNRQYNQKETEGALIQRVNTLFRNCGTKMLVIDEAQHLVDGKRIQKNPAQAADWLKQLMNDTSTSVTLIGIPNVEILLESNSQLRRRFSRKIFIQGHDVATKKSRQELCNTIGRLIEQSGYDGDTSYLYDGRVLRKLYYATDGRIGYIVKLLNESIYLSIQKNRSKLTEVDLYVAFKNVIWFDAKDKFNPFSKSFVNRKLIQRKEPFFEEVAA